MEYIEICCEAHKNCDEKCGLIKAILNYIKDNDLSGVDVRCVNAYPDAKVWSKDVGD